ncbi:MAG: hypothetical protein NTAFB09_21230 [Nitrosospira sp.]
MKAKAGVRVTAVLVAASLNISSAWADNISSENAIQPVNPPPAQAGMPDCTTAERLKELADEGSFAQGSIQEAKDIGANVLGAALGMLAGVDIPIGEARDAYNHARGVKQTYEILTPCTPEQEAEIKKIKEQTGQVVEGENKNPGAIPPSQPDEGTAEKAGKLLRNLPL